jgi:raffinose/stachyose/melibiose transport system permease protein
LFTAGLLFPLNTAALPLFLMLQKIGMNDNLFGVALPEAAFSLPVTIVILRPFMRAIPGELEDAATVDGATRIRFFVRILLPLSRPALITVGILAFVTSWNTYLLPLIVLSTPSHFTLPLAVAMFQSQYSTDTARVFAYTALSMLPALSIFVFAQRYLVGGLVGAIRGGAHGPGMPRGIFLGTGGTPTGMATPLASRNSSPFAVATGLPRSAPDAGRRRRRAGDPAGVLCRPAWG